MLLSAHAVTVMVAMAVRKNMSLVNLIARL